MTYQDHIVRDPHVCGGQPVVRGTRVPLRVILAHLARGETAEEIVAFREEGILTVDMEASAIFTIGDALGVQTASVFCVSDVLHGEEWEAHFQSSNLDENLWRLFEIVESVLTSDGPTPFTSS